MKAEKVAVRFGITKNMGNYEFLRLDYDITIYLDPGDSPSKAIDEGREYLVQKMKKDIEANDGGRSWIK